MHVDSCLIGIDDIAIHDIGIDDIAIHLIGIRISMRTHVAVSCVPTMCMEV